MEDGEKRGDRGLEDGEKVKTGRNEEVEDWRKIGRREGRIRRKGEEMNMGRREKRWRIGGRWEKANM